MKTALFWKLSGLFVVIAVVVIAATGWWSAVLDERYAVASARDVSRFNSEAIVRSLGHLMMSRDVAAIDAMIDDLTSGTPAYRDIRLVSHRGVVAASRSEPGGEPLAPTAPSCRTCHDLADPREGTNAGSYDRVVDLADGTRAVVVVTPILNEPACTTADCHAHAGSATVLGLLETEFSLANVDSLVASRRVQTAVAVAVAILVSTIATWVAVHRLVERPIRELISGTGRISAGDFDFRLTLRRRDELGLLAASFNRMTARLAAGVADLRRTRDHLEGIVENSADIIITVNPEGRIETFNAGAERALGYDRAEVIGGHIERLFADPRERDVAIARLQGTDSVVNYETHFVTKAGEVRDVLLTLSRLRDPEGRAVGTIGISKDVTNEKRLQRELIQSERLAAVGQALVGIEHSIKNMLNALQGGSYLVRTGIAKVDREMLDDGWRMVQEGITALTSMSSRMLRYVREWKPEFRDVDLGEMVTGIHRVAARTAEDAGVALRLEVAPGLPRVRCDADLMHTAVMDVVTNAIAACLQKDYAGGGETPAVVVRVAGADDGDRAAVEVRDNGCGMTEEVKARIFAPFFTTKRSGGTGLGLALVSRIVRVHGGGIHVESEPDRGSVFRIEVPVRGTETNEEEER